MWVQRATLQLKKEVRARWGCGGGWVVSSYIGGVWEGDGCAGSWVGGSLVMGVGLDGWEVIERGDGRGVVGI